MAQRLKYREENVSLVRTSIENFLKTNPEYGFSVKVAGFLVVPRTREISLFDSFRDHVNETTDEVVFTNYHGTGNGGETITLLVNEDAPKNDELRGTQNNQNNVPDRNELRLQIYNELQNDFLSKENERLKRELSKAEKFIKEVDVLLAQLRQQKTQVKDKGTLEVIGNFVARLSAMNPDFMKGNPTLEALLTFLPTSKEEAPPAENPVSGTPEVTIKPKEQAQDPEVGKAVALLKRLRHYFSEKELEDCLKLLNAISDIKELIPYAIQWVERQVEQKRKWMQQRNKPQQQPNAPEPERKNEPDISEEQTSETEIRNNGFPPYEEDEEEIFHP